MSESDVQQYAPREWYLDRSLRWHIASPLTLHVLELAGMYKEGRITYMDFAEKTNKAHLEAMERARQVTESPDGWLLSVMNYEFEKCHEETKIWLPKEKQKSLFMRIIDALM